MNLEKSFVEVREFSTAGFPTECKEFVFPGIYLCTVGLNILSTGQTTETNMGVAESGMFGEVIYSGQERESRHGMKTVVYFLFFIITL